MPSFAYTARETSTGREIRSSVEATNEQSAISALLNRNLLVVSIQEKIAKKGKTQGGKVGLADLVVFTRQLATMIDAGIAIVQALQALADQTANKVMRDTIHDVCTRVEGGESFSEALQKHPKTFNRLYYSMISAGEKGGLLAEIMARLATYLENTERLRKKVKTALMYPTAVTVVAISITTFLLVKVIPTFKDVYSGFGAALPGPTQVLMDISDAVKHYFVVMILVAGASIWGWLYYIKTKSGREFWDSRRIKLPVFGPIAHKICLARFTRTHGLAGAQRRADSGGVANRRSQTVGNVIMEKAIKTASSRHRTRRSASSATALGKNPIFPSMIIRMFERPANRRVTSTACLSASPTSSTRRSTPRSPASCRSSNRCSSASSASSSAAWSSACSCPFSTCPTSSAATNSF